MKRSFIITVLMLLLLMIHADSVLVAPNESQSSDVESLKAAHRKYLKAWSERDIDTIVEMGTGAAGFGHSTAFPRPVRIREPFRNNVIQFFSTMDVFTINIDTENYRVVDDTGLAWGHYSQTTKQKDGPQRTVYLRFAHTFVRDNGQWKLVMYHRSLIPNEDFQ